MVPVTQAKVARPRLSNQGLAGRTRRANFDPHNSDMSLPSVPRARIARPNASADTHTTDGASREVHAFTIENITAAAFLAGRTQ